MRFYKSSYLLRSFDVPGHCSKHFTCINIYYSQFYEEIIILPMRKLRHKAVRYIDESYTASKQQSQDLKLGSLTHS